MKPVIYEIKSEKFQMILEPLNHRREDRNGGRHMGPIATRAHPHAPPHPYSRTECKGQCKSGKTPGHGHEW